MSKLSVKLYDNSFIMCGPSCGTGSTGKAPELLEWYTGAEHRPISVFTDNRLYEALQCDSEYKIAWLIEPRSVSGKAYDDIMRIHANFEYILTSDAILLKEFDRAVPFPLGGHWIAEEDCKIHEVIQ